MFWEIVGAILLANFITGVAKMYLINNDDKNAENIINAIGRLTVELRKD